MTVNIDYICIVTSDGVHQKYQEYPIQKSQDIIDELQRIAADERLTKVDIQEAFHSHFNEKKSYNFCYPWGYFDTCYDYYFGGGAYPQTFSQKEFDEVNQKHKIKYIETAKQAYPDDAERAAKYSSRLYREYLEREKKCYCDDCVNYIYAFDYYRTIDNIKADATIKMFSTEVIGAFGNMSNMRFPINDDLEFAVKTNFRYGWASRFYLNINYKGVDLIFYSDYVNYYYANAIDIVEYTRKYVSKRENWIEAFKFVEKYTNLAKDNPDSFVQKFIYGQVEMMMHDLQLLMNSNDYLGGLIERTLQFANYDSAYIGLRHINGWEKEEYALHREEMEITFKMEKLSGALELLESMKKNAVIFPKLNAYIEEIKELNRSIASPLQSLINDLTTEISLLTLKIERIKAEINQVCELLSPYYDELEDATRGMPYSESDAYRMNYKVEHHEYVALLNKKSNLVASKNETMSIIDYRNSYKDKLKKCLNTIRRFGLWPK